MDEADNVKIHIPSINHPQSELFETGRMERMFTKLKLIGEGAFGRVFKGVNRIEGKKYAIKRIFFRVDRNQNIQEHPFFREVTALTKLSHPSIVRHHSTWIEENLEPDDFGKSLETDEDYEEPFQNDQISLNDLGFEWEEKSKTKEKSLSESTNQLKAADKLNLILNIQMSYYSPKTLKDLIQEKDLLSFDFKLSIIKQLLEGLKYIHFNGFIHRDIKPSNIFFASEKSIIIGDFGLAIESLSKFKDKDVFGTFNYSAPEIEQGLGYDNTIDIYSAGIIFYELFEDFQTEHERFMKIKGLRSNKMNFEFQNNYPFISSIISKMIASDPSHRFSSANEILSSENWKELKKQRSNLS